MLLLTTGPKPVKHVFCKEIRQDIMEKTNADLRLPGINKSVALSGAALAESCTAGLPEPEARL